MNINKAACIFMSLILLFLAVSCDTPGSPGSLASSTTGSSQVWMGFDPGSMTGTLVCQGFTLDNTATVTGIRLFITTKTGTPTGDYIVSIKTDNAGKPSATNADANATLSKNAASITQNAWNTWTFPASFSLSGSTQYWVVVTTNENDMTGANGIYFGYDNAGSYAGGAMGTYDSMVTFTWTINTANDLKFIVQ
ncbi:MAG: hypothetical protein JW904_05370 [Spirochaetales bacterium]|nr:hypothetical protein [Spirochaetales bacterium]